MALPDNPACEKYRQRADETDEAYGARFDTFWRHRDGEDPADYEARMRDIAHCLDVQFAGDCRTHPTKKGLTMNYQIRAAEQAAVRKMQALRQAEKDVQPIIGEVGGMDSAEAVYKMALDHLGIDVRAVNPAGYGAIVRAYRDRGATLAKDSAHKRKDFWSNFSKNIVLPSRG